MVRIYEKAKKEPKELDRYFGVTIGDICQTSACMPTSMNANGTGKTNI